MIFRQLFEAESSTYTYFIADLQSRHALFIDPVATEIETYLALLKTHGCKLTYSLETHVHADHITGSGLLRQRTGAKTGVGSQCGAQCADLQLEDGAVLQLGKQRIHVIATPGHTPGSLSYLWNGRLFSGDTLLINGCGRTDFQGGDAGTLYDSITQRLFTLPGETLVYPGHDYHGRMVSCIAQERDINPRLAGKTRAEFIRILANLNLPQPRLIDIAVPSNRMCGIPDEEEALPQG
jgi:glyoxylase-like metal-dependent hydrolase (beta-lactamase superfamily II)